MSHLQEMSAKNKKHPAMYLQEVCTREGCTYIMSTNDLNNTVSHEPSFEVTLSVDNFDGKDYKGIGVARNKKDAKQKAALHLLFQILSVAELSENVLVPSSETPLLVQMDSTKPSRSTRDEPENSPTAVQDLVELCAKKGLPDPEYKELAAEGPSHQPSFTWECRVKFPDDREDLVVVDKAKQKKEAKRLLASLMIIKVRQEVAAISDPPISLDGTNFPDSLPIGGGSVSLCDNRAKCHELFAHEHHQFYRFKGKSIQEDVTIFEDGKNYIVMLDNIAEEENFTVEYDELPGQNCLGNIQCVCKMTYNKFKGYYPSPSVIFGSGRTSQTAQNNVAYESLQFLKGVTNSVTPVNPFY